MTHPLLASGLFSALSATPASLPPTGLSPASLPPTGLSPASLRNAAASPATAAPSPRLVRSAHQFEAAMMKELLGPLNGDSGGFGDPDADSGGGLSGSAGALGAFASEALGQAISEHGGFGIATSILHQLGKATLSQPGTGNQIGTVSVPGMPRTPHHFSPSND